MLPVDGSSWEAEGQKRDLSPLLNTEPAKFYDFVESQGLSRRTALWWMAQTGMDAEMILFRNMHTVKGNTVPSA